MSTYNKKILYDFEKYKEFYINEVENDVLGDDLSACWCYSYYIHFKLNLPIINFECIYENKINIEDLDFSSIVSGILSCFISFKSEMHHFILIFNNNTVELFSTYGGQNGIIIKMFNKFDFLNELQLLSTNTDIANDVKTNKYYNLFGITNYTNKKLNFDNFEYYHTYRTYTF